MFKKRFISMLVLLMTAVTGAWADTTVTWEGTKLQSIAVSKGYGNNVTTESMTVDGITITANNGYLLNGREGVELYSGAANGVVFSAENNIKSITITSTGFSKFTPDGGYQFGGGSHTYEVSPAATSYGFANSVSITGITKIEITLEGAPTVAVTGVTLAPTSATLTLGETETVTLIPTVLPAEATDKSVTWSSSDEAVATVADGVVTAVAAGTATITVTTTDGAKTATCAVTVAAPAASTYTVTLKEGTEDATSWTIAPAEATTTGVAAGTEVKATYSGTKKVKSVKAKKAAPANVPVESITLNKTATTIQAGQTETLSVSSVTPDDATDQTVTWSSDNEAVATVNATTGEVTAVAFGTANITATANDGSGVTATCAVTVSKVVTINQSDWGMNYSFTKDGVTVSADYIDREEGNIMGPGTFSTTLGNFTKIVVTTEYCDAYGTGWSGSYSSKTWAGTPASTVSFSGNFQGMGETQTTIVCTIVPKN